MPRHLGSERAVLREARLAATVLWEPRLVAAVLREARLVAAVLREAMAGSFCLRDLAIITSNSEGRASSRDDLLRVALLVRGDYLIHRITHRQAPTRSAQTVSAAWRRAKDPQLRKTRRRDERTIDYGRYILVNDRSSCLFGTHNSGRAMASLEEIENYLTSEPSGRRARNRTNERCGRHA
jgi:hypothetical protein